MGEPDQQVQAVLDELKGRANAFLDGLEVRPMPTRWTAQEMGWVLRPDLGTEGYDVWERPDGTFKPIRAGQKPVEWRLE